MNKIYNTDMKLFPVHIWKRQYQVQNADYKLNFCFIKWKYVHIQRYVYILKEKQWKDKAKTQ